MRHRDDPNDERRSARSADVLRYALVWLAGGAAVAASLALLIGRNEDATVPPLKQTQLENAARVAHCELRRAVHGEVLDPPVEGPRTASPLVPGVYEEPTRADAVVAALREGAIVVHYRRGLDDDRVEQLAELQTAVPEGTIVLPSERPMRYELAVTAWRRLLGCARFTDEAIDALQLFRGRFIGRGPDRR